MKHLYSVCLVSSCMLASISLDRLQEMSAYELFGLVERVKIATFSTDSFARSGLDDVQARQWNELTDTANELVMQSVSASKKKHYNALIRDLDRARSYIEASIVALHDGLDVSFAYVQKYGLDMHLLQAQLFDEIKRATKPGRDWIDAITYPILSVVQERLIADFKYLVKQAQQDDTPLKEQEISGLLRLHQIESTAQVNRLLNSLEQYCYRKEKDAKYARMFIKELRELYPDALSSYDMSVLANTHDIVHTLLFVQAGAYDNILRQILREIDA